MPFKIRKLPGRDTYRVYQLDDQGRTVRIRARETTLSKAKGLVRLLHGVEHGWTPSKKRVKK
ncbi:hypothetical protein EBZ80_24410 [bacterium]|nr:hypothetical protein [bacterium]